MFRTSDARGHQIEVFVARGDHAAADKSLTPGVDVTRFKMQFQIKNRAVLTIQRAFIQADIGPW